MPIGKSTYIIALVLVIVIILLVYFGVYSNNTVKTSLTTTVITSTSILPTTTSNFTASNNLASTLYVVNFGSNTVSVINMANNTVTKTIKVGSYPLSIMLSSNGSYAYVPNAGSNTVSVINTSTNLLVSNIALNSSPTGIALSPNGKYLYVASCSLSSPGLYVIDTSSERVVYKILNKPGFSPCDLAITSNGEYLYADTGVYDTVLVINTTNYNFSTVNSNTINLDFSAIDLSNDNKQAYILSYQDGSIRVMNTSNNSFVRKVSLGFNYLGTMSLSSNGRFLYVSDYYGANAISIVNLSSYSVAGTISTGANPSFALPSQNNSYLYVADYGANNVSIIDTQTGVTKAIISVGVEPISIAIKT